MLTSPHLSVAQVAERFGVSEDKVYLWIRNNDLVAINAATSRNGKPRWKVSTLALEAFEASRTNEKPQPAKIRKPRRPVGNATRQWIK